MLTSDKAMSMQLAHTVQCIIPVVEGLLPEKDEKDVLDLIFILATWHAYAKLRLHTEHTLSSFDALTKPLGAALRHFAGKFSDRFDTKELPKEADARKQREAKGKHKGKSTRQKTSRGKVRFNPSTYKLHALGDYADTIRWRGTTDSYSTQMVRAFSVSIPTHRGNLIILLGRVRTSACQTFLCSYEPPAGCQVD